MAPLSVYADVQLDSSGPGQAMSEVTPFLVDLPVGEGNAVVRLSQIAHATESNPGAASLVDARTIVTLSGFAPPAVYRDGFEAISRCFTPDSSAVPSRMIGQNGPQIIVLTYFCNAY